MNNERAIRNNEQEIAKNKRELAINKEINFILNQPATLVARLRDQIVNRRAAAEEESDYETEDRRGQVITENLENYALRENPGRDSSDEEGEPETELQDHIEETTNMYEGDVTYGIQCNRYDT